MTHTPSSWKPSVSFCICYLLLRGNRICVVRGHHQRPSGRSRDRARHGQLGLWAQMGPRGPRTLTAPQTWRLTASRLSLVPRNPLGLKVPWAVACPRPPLHSPLQQPSGQPTHSCVCCPCLEATPQGPQHQLSPVRTCDIFTLQGPPVPRKWPQGRCTWLQVHGEGSGGEGKVDGEGSQGGRQENRAGTAGAGTIGARLLNPRSCGS